MWADPQRLQKNGRAKMARKGIAIVASLASLAVPAAASAQAGQELLIDVARLASIIDSPDLVLLHVGDRAEYDAAHIEGARFVQLADISAPRDAGPALELPAPDALRSTLQSLGVSDDSRIVVYFGNDWVTPATRVVLTLTWAGLGERTRLLDGGLNAWRAAGHEVTATAPPQRTGTLSPLRTRPVVVTAEDVRAHLTGDGYAIIDARAPRFYEGAYEQRGEERPGRIAGARSVPFTDVVDDALRMKDADALRALFRQAGVQPTDTVIAYCHIGQQATLVVFAARLIGQPVVLYDGSYTQWGSNPELPIEKGPPGGGGDTASGGAAVRVTERPSLPRLLASPLLSARGRTSDR
jgi:thiosulfate/3-mercaptopyruvate sulfurtransferase